MRQMQLDYQIFRNGIIYLLHIGIHYTHHNKAIVLFSVLVHLFHCDCRFIAFICDSNSI